MATLSMELAASVWKAHREIEMAKRLLADIEKAQNWGDDGMPKDPFGHRRPFTFGIPSGNSSERLIDVSPTLAVYVIRAHIAAKEKELVEASEAVRMQLDGLVPDGDVRDPGEAADAGRVG